MPRLHHGAVPVACLLLGGIVSGAAAGTEGPSPAPATETVSGGTAIGLPADDGARIIAVTVLDARTRDLAIESPVVGVVQVRLLLPEMFETQADATFPVLYLLHGGGGEHVDWTEETDVEAYTAPTDLLVAMPAAASSAMDTWQPREGSLASGDRPDWETFHLVELRQLLVRNWRAGHARAVAGLSLGGWAAMMYAARHPGMFAAVGSYSGVLDVTVDPGGAADARTAVEMATGIAEASGWDQVNPINLVPSLAGTPMYLSYGNGEPGPLDPLGIGTDELEAWVGAGDEHFVEALGAAGIPASVNAYGPGTHAWAYWDRELEASLPLLLEALDEGAAGASASPPDAP